MSVTQSAAHCAGRQPAMSDCSSQAYLPRTTSLARRRLDPAVARNRLGPAVDREKMHPALRCKHFDPEEYIEPLLYKQRSIGELEWCRANQRIQSNYRTCTYAVRVWSRSSRGRRPK
ncbi:hypothetical protein AcV5_010438 [Taiwanofungus camphoratus]|nr:hypothetical protein AcV5_010438 [Antrodia cinnamomea]